MKHFYKTLDAKISKYGAKKAEADGIIFHSKKERDYYVILKHKKDAGHIKFFLMQVPFRLPGNVRFILDFLVMNIDGTVDYIDVKGFLTPTAIIKIKQVEDLYKIPITII